MTGRAIVRLKNGSRYVAEHVEVAAGAVTVTAGRLTIRDVAGERRYAPRSFTVPLRATARIEWLADEAATRLPELAAAA